MSIQPGQWRLAEIQVANWGTFDGRIYRIPVARRGHLITGASGSGKSSLLDAIASVMTPDVWLRFNLAAQGGGARTDQRSILSYLRGAWSKTTDAIEDRVVSAYLRPAAAWSGIVLRFEDGAGGIVTLARLFVVKGTGTEWNDLCLLERSAIDLEEMQTFVSAGIETRRVQERWPDAVVTTKGNSGHSRFYARMRLLFGIEHENALQLLHKTQSAKNLDSLDGLFRDFMLDHPETFDIADNAVQQFGELRDAHEHVVQLRLQRDHLRGLASASQSFDLATDAATRARALGDAIVPFQKREALRLSHQEQLETATQVLALDAARSVADSEYHRADEAWGIALMRERSLGGDTAQLQERIRSAGAAVEATGRRFDSFAHQLDEARIDARPSSAMEFAELMTTIDDELASESVGGASVEQLDRFSTARRTHEALAREAQSIRDARSAVPSRLIDVRKRIATAIGVEPRSLPFAAEVIDVLPEFADWMGAIERVLRPFALTLLVPLDRSKEVRRFVDREHLGVRLTFEEVSPNPPPPRPVTSDRSLVHRVAVSDGPFAQWVQSQLADRFDVACVDSPDDFDAHTRAVTINGQVKTGRARFEKDDTNDVQDRSNWYLGDIERTLEEVLARLAEAKRELDDAKVIVDRADREVRRASQRRGVLLSLRHYDWASIDSTTAEAELSRLNEQLADLTRDDPERHDAIAATRHAEAARTRASDLRDAARDALRSAQDRADEIARALRDLEAQFALGTIPELDDATYAELHRRFHSLNRSISRTTLPDIGQEVGRTLLVEADRATAVARSAQDDIIALETSFIGRWPAPAADLTSRLEDRHGFLDLLADIEARGLPDHESTFRRLLREKSRDVIADLVSEILQATEAIKDRIAPVNDSLRRSPFDEDRFLRIRVRARRSETVTHFISQLRSVADHSWSDTDLDGDERRFETLESIMRRLASSDSVDRSWRAQCLDTRLHVSFLADEIDEFGATHATYDSGAAMSGGQQQKLVIFCLAAALRYQLADADNPVPRFGTIVLDEAFDKADTRYTRMALDVFREFGFHLVLATPQKLLQTIEPYIGGATSVENPTRKLTLLANVPWEDGS